MPGVQSPAPSCHEACLVLSCCSGQGSEAVGSGVGWGGLGGGRENQLPVGGGVRPWGGGAGEELMAVGIASLWSSWDTSLGKMCSARCRRAHLPDPATHLAS